MRTGSIMTAVMILGLACACGREVPEGIDGPRPAASATEQVRAVLGPHFAIIDGLEEVLACGLRPATPSERVQAVPAAVGERVGAGVVETAVPLDPAATRALRTLLMNPASFAGPAQAPAGERPGLPTLILRGREGVTVLRWDPDTKRAALGVPGAAERWFGLAAAASESLAALVPKPGPR